MLNSVTSKRGLKLVIFSIWIDTIWLTKQSIWKLSPLANKPINNNQRLAGRWEDEEEIREPAPKAARGSGGVAIAPPPSLQDSPESAPLYLTKPPVAPPAAPYGGGSVAAKIMAKYGFKEGQGLGKQEQGMSMALQVEKTSKRGGRIIHEKEILPPLTRDGSPEDEPSITEIMKSPSKVLEKLNVYKILFGNVVGGSAA